MPAIARAVPGWSIEPKTQSISPLCQGPKNLRRHNFLPVFALAGTWSQEMEPRIKPRCSNVGHRCLNHQAKLLCPDIQFLIIQKSLWSICSLSPHTLFILSFYFNVPINRWNHKSQAEMAQAINSLGELQVTSAGDCLERKLLLTLGSGSREPASLFVRPVFMSANRTECAHARREL